MSAVNIQLVREYFELNLFYILPHWGVEAAQTKDQDTVPSLLFVEQAEAPTLPPPGFLLGSGDIKNIHRAAVEVRAWHGGRLYSSAMGADSLFSRVASQQTHRLASNIFHSDSYKILLVVAELPSSASARIQSLETLQSFGIHHVIEFRTILGDLLKQISIHGNYGPSKTLQSLKLLKRYNFIRPQDLEQLELPFDS
ncbi:MAG: hypothetical protein GX130_11650 [Candidatus Hydrogenedens sp.]|nr:hypothetical protein [Candidatus Hydrogenedens sp.]